MKYQNIKVKTTHPQQAIGTKVTPPAAHSSGIREECHWEIVITYYTQLLQAVQNKQMKLQMVQFMQRAPWIRGPSMRAFEATMWEETALYFQNQELTSSITHYQKLTGTKQIGGERNGSSQTQLHSSHPFSLVDHSVQPGLPSPNHSLTLTASTLTLQQPPIPPIGLNKNTNRMANGKQ